MATQPTRRPGRELLREIDTEQARYEAAVAARTQQEETKPQEGTQR